MISGSLFSCRRRTQMNMSTANTSGTSHSGNKMKNGTSIRPRNTSTANVAGVRRTSQTKTSALTSADGTTTHGSSFGGGTRQGMANTQGSNRSAGTMA